MNFKQLLGFAAIAGVMASCRSAPAEEAALPTRATPTANATPTASQVTADSIWNVSKESYETAIRNADGNAALLFQDKMGEKYGYPVNKNTYNIGGVKLARFAVVRLDSNDIHAEVYVPQDGVRGYYGSRLAQKNSPYTMTERLEDGFNCANSNDGFARVITLSYKGTPSAARGKDTQTSLTELKMYAEMGSLNDMSDDPCDCKGESEKVPATAIIYTRTAGIQPSSLADAINMIGDVKRYLHENVVSIARVAIPIELNGNTGEITGYNIFTAPSEQKNAKEFQTVKETVTFDTTKPVAASAVSVTAANASDKARKKSLQKAGY